MPVHDLYDFQGKTALITGASSGLGERFAQCLSDAGARVILASRNFKKLEALSKTLKNAKAIQMDVTDQKSVQTCFDDLDAAGEKIDICVNNAGIRKLTPILDTSETENFEDVIKTNLLGVWFVAKSASIHMASHKVPGSIINIGSVAGTRSYREGASAYSTSKAGVITLTQSLVGELSPHNIRINCINPGLYETPLTESSVRLLETDENLGHKIPLGFIPKPNDLDGLVLYLASNAASRYVTGSYFNIDGGMTCNPNRL